MLHVTFEDPLARMAIFETLCDYVAKSIETLNKPIDLDENK